MDHDLLSCTFEKLNNLKFNELRKFSSQFQVNKRWAKKREIIDTILSLKDRELKKIAAYKNSEKNIKENENFEWISGEKIFLSSETEKNLNSDENNRRLTYNVIDPVFKRLTFNISKNKEKHIPSDENIEMLDNIDRRFTYNISDLKCSLDSKKRKMELPEITKKDLIPTVLNSFECLKDFSQDNSLKNKSRNIKTHLTLGRVSYKEHHAAIDVKNVENYDIEKNSKLNEKIVNNSLNNTKEHNEPQSSKIKMLTIPYSRILRQNRKTLIKESKITDSSKLKISEKSIKIQKLNELIISPQQTTRINKLKVNEEFLGVSTSKKLEEKLFTGNNSSNKQNLKDMPHVLHEKNNDKMTDDKQIQKKEDCILKPNLKSNIELKLIKSLPKGSNFDNSKMSAEPIHKSDGKMNSKSNIPRAKSSIPTSKIITATKMPDFSKIHKKRFEQMDSLHDYQRKKKERIKKLFGIPQPGIPVKIIKTTENSIFHFKSCEKANNQVDKTAIISIKGTPITSEKEKTSKKEALRFGGSESDIINTLKEENRKHLHGVRTNKRFELQMKFRNL